MEGPGIESQSFDEGRTLEVSAEKNRPFRPTPNLPSLREKGWRRLRLHIRGANRVLEEGSVSLANL